MKKSTLYFTAAIIATGALATLAFLVYQNRLKNSECETIFDHPDDEFERLDVRQHQPGDKHHTSLLSGFGADRMDDDATVDTRLHSN